MTGSKTPSAEPVRTAAVITRGRPEAIGEALELLERVAREAGVELFYPEDEAEKHERNATMPALQKVDLVVVLGGDGTMLRALRRTLGTGTPVVGVNFGTVGFLTSITADALEAGLRRVFAGDYEIAELPTLDIELGGEPPFRRQRHRDRQLDHRPHDRARLGRRRRGSRRRSAATASSARPRPGRPATTSRTAARSSSGASTRRSSRSSRRIRCTQEPSSCPAAGTSRSRTARPTCRPRCSSTDNPGRARARRKRGRSARRAVQPPGAPARGDLLQPLPGDLCSVGCGSRTSS